MCRLLLFFQCYFLFPLSCFDSHFEAHFPNYNYSWCWLGWGKYASRRLWNNWCQFPKAPNPTIGTRWHSKHYRGFLSKVNFTFPDAKCRNSSFCTALATFHVLQGSPGDASLSWLPDEQWRKFWKMLMDCKFGGYFILYSSVIFLTPWSNKNVKIWCF